jgi:hypothetical protein
VSNTSVNPDPQPLVPGPLRQRDKAVRELDLIHCDAARRRVAGSGLEAVAVLAVLGAGRPAVVDEDPVVTGCLQWR